MPLFAREDSGIVADGTHSLEPAGSRVVVACSWREACQPLSESDIDRNSMQDQVRALVPFLALALALVLYLA